MPKTSRRFAAADAPAPAGYTPPANPELLKEFTRTALDKIKVVPVTRAAYPLLREAGLLAVRGRVVEDMAFGDAARRQGLPMACLAGRGCVDFRMYPDGFRAMVEGWSKGMASGSVSAQPLARGLMIAWITGATSSVVLLAMGIAALAGSASGGADAVFGAWTVGIYVLYAGQAGWMLRRIGSFGPVTALAFPLPLAFFHAVFAWSLWLSNVRGSVTWRGRRVRVGSLRSPPVRPRARG